MTSAPSVCCPMGCAMSDFATAALALADSTLIRWLAFTAITTALATWTISRVLTWHTDTRNHGDQLAADHYGLPAPDATDEEFTRWAMQALDLGNSAAFEAAVLRDIEAITGGEVA